MQNVRRTMKASGQPLCVAYPAPGIRVRRIWVNLHAAAAMLARLTIVFAAVATAAGQYCPALSPDPHAPLSDILKDVCKRGEGGVDCSDIPVLLDQLADGSPKPNQFSLANDAATFMCDPCLGPIREGLFYIADPVAHGHAPKAVITDDGAYHSACETCLPKYEAIANKFGGEAKKQFANLKAACGSHDAHKAGTATGEMMKALFSSLDSVRDLASLKQETAPLAPRSFGASKGLRVAAYGCLALGSALLAAAALISRRPAEAKPMPDSELL